MGDIKLKSVLLEEQTGLLGLLYTMRCEVNINHTGETVLVVRDRLAMAN